MVSDQSVDGAERSCTTLTNGFINMGGWIPVASDWEPNIGRWWFEAYYCVEGNLGRQIRSLRSATDREGSQ